MPILAIQPILYTSTFFPLGVGIPQEYGTGSEFIFPYSASFVAGDEWVLQATQNLYSFDFFAVYPPHRVVESDLWKITSYGFTASFDPTTKVELGGTDDVVGSMTKIIARYR